MGTKLLIVFLISVVLISGCTGQKTVTKTDITPAAPNSVAIKGFAFAPETITVAKGTTVTWTNMDSVAHTVVAADNAFSSQTLENGQSYAHTFNDIGTFEYKCSIHPGMSGKVIVT
ncbi:MAG: cupredoxin family copper-binding protein [Candidatus Methanoperedens sp.]|nr:cupredoxin family copper-binding protein [Candidatus Methanoperedens sp.]